jgi:hypothetical protein
MLFQSKIDPFSSFTINQGPLYAERVFESLLTKLGATAVGKMNDTHRYERCLGYLKQTIAAQGRNQYAFSQFYMAYFYQRLFQHATNEKERLHFQEKALCHFQCYLDLPAVADESRFYAQWHTGLLLDELGYSWHLAEASLLAASDSDPVRGEALARIVRHHVRNREWRKAYTYSMLSIDTFFDRNPIAIRRWFVDFDAYNWTLLNTHLNICYKLELFKEAKSTYDRMLRYQLEHLHEFKNSDIRLVHSLSKLFQLAQRKTAIV